MPKDFYHSELNVGDEVAFNWCGAVRFGVIKEIKNKRKRLDYKYVGGKNGGIKKEWNYYNYPTFIIQHFFRGGTSEVKNIEGIVKLKIDMDVIPS